VIPINQFVEHQQKKMFWGYFGYCCVGSLQPIKDMMRPPKYIEVLRRRVLEKRYLDGSGIFSRIVPPVTHGTL